MKLAHRLVGALGLVAFVLTGQHMHWHLNHLRGLTDGPRMMFRTAHIYILWSALLNLIIGLYLTLAPQKWARYAQIFGGLAIMASLPLICFSFFNESNHADLRRGMARLGIYCALAGTMMHMASVCVSERSTSNR